MLQTNPDDRLVILRNQDGNPIGAKRIGDCSYDEIEAAMRFLTERIERARLVIDVASNLLTEGKT